MDAEAAARRMGASEGVFCMRRMRSMCASVREKVYSSVV